MNKLLLYIMLLAMEVMASGCASESNNTPTEGNGPLAYSVTLDGTEIDALHFDYRKSRKVIQLVTNKSWSLSSDQEWCHVSNRSGDATLTTYQTMNLVINVDENDSDFDRSATLKLLTGGETVIINVSQTSKSNVIRPDGFPNDAFQLMKKIYLGVNLGNTLEVPDADETGWGNPKASYENFANFKKLGFNATRIPCSWNQHLIDDNYTIDPAWLARVKEVVDYSVDQGMYTMLNIHWDGGWMERHCGVDYITEDEITEVDTKLGRIWTQIAEYFIDYEEHLLFACANEPDVKTAAHMVNLARYEQTFVNAVRGTGGNNLYRCIVVQGPSTDMELSLELMKFPEDPTPNSMIFEVHFYAPWTMWKDYDDPEHPFDDPLATFFWGEPYIQYGKYDTEWQEAQILALYDKVQAKFVDNGYPIIVGEYGIVGRDIKNEELQPYHNASRQYYHSYVVKQMKNHGMVPFLWDTGGYISRYDGSILDPYIIDGSFEGAALGEYPF